eukprot:scaffold42954_cov74-Phaeocystis_antarctica.AAC.6
MAEDGGYVGGDGVRMALLGLCRAPGLSSATLSRVRSAPCARAAAGTFRKLDTAYTNRARTYLQNIPW